THSRGKIGGKLKNMLKSEAKHFDFIVHTGDFTSIEAALSIEAISGIPLIGVSGNMDNDEVRSHYPYKKTLSVEKLRVGIIHGWGPPYDLIERIDKEFEDEDIIIFGHTHIPCEKIFNGKRFLNPGSASNNRNGIGESIGILEIDGKKADFKIRYL
ncbi:MAG: YfcE family phosphodiesterase, partial [Candidatus Schekmanbacteria bacterium]